MSETPIREGRVPFDVTSIDQTCFTYYKIVDDLSCGAPPVVVLHGGPGTGHEYLLPYARLWDGYGLPLVFYDQIGCAASTHLPEKAGDESFWQEQLFQDELNNLLDHLDLRRGAGFHLLGQSWGGMLGAGFASTRPPGLRKLVLASGLTSAELANRGYRILRSQMPLEMQQALDEAERTGNYSTPAYNEAMNYYRTNYVYRTVPFPPPELLPAFQHLSEDKTVYSTMYGPTSLTMGGTLSNWTAIPRLPRIAAPTLVFNGDNDTSHDVAQAPFFELIPRVRWITFPNSGHMCHLEGGGLRERVIKVVGDFLTQQEQEETSEP
ncbi:proline-specific peptidase [Xylariomycetidae sp. FL2044]|nr:proline-specific peptidase [Xylariomycetidae sp. FL2044]